MVKLIATDMDGTLLNDKGTINENVFSLINKLKSNNIKFAAASGRFYCQLSRNFEKVKEDMIFIAHNGAFVKYNKGGKTLYSDEISKELLDHAVKLNPNLGEELFLSGESEAYIVSPTEHMLNTFSYFHVPAVILKSFSEIKAPIYKITYHMKDGVNNEILEFLKENLDHRLQFVQSGDNWIDIMKKSTSKGNAIKILQEKFKIEKENTMVFGDYYNDLSMFKMAHHSYAMGNAPEEVKGKANFIAKTNNEDGVYNVLNEMLG
ncbi:HAD family hydrolase [Clostridium oceanicum]|uniref:Cof-type HAD-IIB family hydrolase n=1 Tax=Clostridium oceanicum TaxID=1543 RepID=A0ABN1JF31_9CLOT